MNQKLVVVGSSNIDLLMKVNRLPEKGETVTDGEFLQCYGGKGANQAVAAARARGEVAFVSCVGDGSGSSASSESSGSSALLCRVSDVGARLPGSNSELAQPGDPSEDVSNRLQIKIKRAPWQSRRVKVANMATG